MKGAAGGTGPRSARGPGDAAALGGRRPQTGKEIQAGFGAEAPAITTVLTVLDRLRRMGLVQRSDARTNITFRPAQSESDRALETMLQSLQSTGDREAVLLRFVGDLDGEDAELLRKALQGRSPHWAKGRG